jgi:RHS repeat-associated protein
VGVKDKVAPSAYNDIDNQTSYNYTYDAIGNLVGDVAEGISNISWTVYGKIKSISKTNGTLIRYGYDAAGNRISKIVTTATTGDSTYYVRDASGNTMAVYNKSGALPLTQTEAHLYSSSRLAIHNLATDVQNCAANSPTVFNFTRGNKFFELANHLGNVFVTISDKKIGIDPTADGTTDYNNADVVTVSDYYGFGMNMPGRSYNAGSEYRYGLNGKERDNEIKGEGNSLDFGDRMYDPRLGRWNKVDIKQEKYPGYSPYHFGYDNPIITIDPNGEENIVVIGNQSNAKGTVEPYSDFKNGKKEQGYRYGENRRHFLERGLNEALALKKNKTDNNEGTTIIVYKGTYTEAEIKHYQEKATKAGINFLVAENNTQIVNYINDKEFESNADWWFGDERGSDKITDFTYVGHGSPDKMWTGHAYDESYFDTKNFEIDEFSTSCNVTLLGCGNGVEVEELNQVNARGYKDRTAPTIFDDFQDRIIGSGGTITGFITTVIWGGAGLGTTAPHNQGYLFANDRNGTIQRNNVPADKAKKTEKGVADR